MLRQLRLLIGISIFWLALNRLLDGVNTLILPVQVSKLAGQATQATVLGLLTFIGLLMGAFVQPVAGAFSDRWKPVLGRKGFIGIGPALILISLLFFATFKNLTGIVIGYLLIQISASIARRRGRCARHRDRTRSRAGTKLPALAGERTLQLHESPGDFLEVHPGETGGPPLVETQNADVPALDPGFRRDDEFFGISTYYEIINSVNRDLFGVV